MNPPCHGLTDQFFAASSIGRSGTKTKEQTQQINEAKAICSTCIHKEKCLTGAIERNEQIGIWGGVNFFNRTEKKLVMSKQKARL